MNYSPEIIGNKIKEQRSKKKWSQDTLGKKLNMSGKQISNYEKAILTPPIDILFKPCEIFDCELGFLLGEDNYESGTILDTAIENKLRISKEAISSLCHLTGNDRSSILWGHESESFQKILNSLFCSDAFSALVYSMHDLDNAIQNSKAIWDELYGKYGKEKMDQAFKYYNSTTDYLLDENAEKLEDIYYEILVAIESATDKDHDASFPIKVLRYEVRETFERLLDDLYPQ